MIVNQHISDLVGGSEIQCDNLAKGLSNKGHSVVYAATGRLRKTSYEYEYPVYALDVYNKKEVEDFLISHKPDVIYWRYNKIGLRSFFKKVPDSVGFVFASSALNDFLKYGAASSFFVNPFGLKESLSRIKSKLISAYNYKTLSQVDLVTVLNRDYLKLSPNKNTQLVTNSMSCKVLSDFDYKKKFVVWVANIKPQKQPEKFIELASELSKNYPDIDFLMIGNIQDKQYQNIIQKAEAKILNFYYLGGKTPDEVNAVLEKSLFLVHTCQPEGFGNNFIQAWMQAKPTISLEFDPAGLIESQGLGFVSGNFDNFLKQSKKLIEDESLRKSIGKNAQIYAKENFSIDTMVNKIEELLTEVVNGKNK